MVPPCVLTLVPPDVFFRFLISIDCGGQYLWIARGMSSGLHSALNKSGIHAGGSSIWGSQQGQFPRFLIVSSLPCVA